MFLTNTWAIREVIAFPTLRPIMKQPELTKEKAKAVPQVKAAPSAKSRITQPLPSRKEC